MPTYLLDSCICIDCMRGKLPYAYELMRKSEPSQFKVPSIALGELEVGVVKSANVQKNRRLLERFIAPFEVLPFDEECARVYGRIRGETKLQGARIGVNDMQIAAIALRYGCTLVSNNAHDFNRIPRLGFESWYETDL